MPRLWVRILHNTDPAQLERLTNQLFYRATTNNAQIQSITVSQDAQTVVVVYIAPSDI